MNFRELCQSLEGKIQNSYIEGVTTEAAELLAGEFLYAQMAVSSELKKADLDSRMKKTSLKSIRATMYNGIVSGSDKKPTEASIESQINTNDIVIKTQDELDQSEVERDNLMRCYNIFREAHIHFRGIAKGKFDGV